MAHIDTGCEFLVPSVVWKGWQPAGLYRVQIIYV